MAEKQPSNVDRWLEWETPRVRKALESASRYFDSNDELTVNMLEAVYGQENSFGILMGKRGSARAAGHFQFEPKTAKRYGLTVAKRNDQRFDIDRASSAAARYLKDLNTWFGKRTTLLEGLRTIPVKGISERKKFVLGAFNAGEGRIAGAQRRAEKAGKDPQLWSDIATYLPKETQQYVERIPLEGRWRTIDDRPVFICA